MVSMSIRSFFTEVLRIGAYDYTPTENDVLRAQVKTSGVTVTQFNMGQLSWVYWHAGALFVIAVS